MSFLTKQYTIIRAFFFAGIISKKAFFDSHPGYDSALDLYRFLDKQREQRDFQRSVKSMGYSVISKPVASVYDNTKGEYKRKCNFDVEMTIKAIDFMPNYDELVLCSGDGDFVKLIKYIKGKYKKTTVIGHKDRFNWELQKAANRTLFLEDIKAIIIK